jgi:hypothetical protein
MKPFYDKGQFRNDLPSPGTTTPAFVPSKTGYGVEIRYGRDIKKRENSFFISSGKWAEMSNDGLIDQEISPSVIGELIDPLDIVPFADADERKSLTAVLESGEIILGQSIDYEGGANKDGRITVFDIRARGYVVNEEIPFKTRGIKAVDETISGISSGISVFSFLDGGESSLGITREGFYGSKKITTDPFTDREIVNDFNMILDDTGDYDSTESIGTHGFSLYSSEFGTDSVAFLGLLK